MTSFTTVLLDPKTSNGRRRTGGRRGGMVPPRSTPVNTPPIPSPDADKPPAIVDDRDRRGVHADRPRADGRGQHPGVSAAGKAFRRGSRLLGDGLGGR